MEWWQWVIATVLSGIFLFLILDILNAVSKLYEARAEFYKAQTEAIRNNNHKSKETA